MSGPSSAREALIAETLGEMAAILDRVEAVGPMLSEACTAVTQASALLAAQAAAVDSRVAAITDAGAAQAIQRVARRADDLVRVAAQAETQAMEAAARKLFREELGPALQRLAVIVDRSAGLRRAVAASWWAHAVTALAASAITGTLTAYCLTR